ncbi:hypothetical protein BDZ91DRAFT_782690 [Kalaharituber pfeilii]|nr:hypothetical protein BDZ91DRAFT_782690 [Kalaharituber pfeilii]
MPPAQLSNIHQGSILWLPETAVIPGIPKGKLQHPVVVLSDVVNNSVDVCIITSLRNQSLETKFRDPRLRERYVQLEHPGVNDSMYHPGFPTPTASTSNLAKVTKVKVRVIRGDNPLPKKSYIDIGEPLRCPVTSLEELKWGRAEACLAGAAVVIVRTEVKRITPHYQFLVKPTAAVTLGSKRSGLQVGRSTYGNRVVPTGIGTYSEVARRKDFAVNGSASYPASAYTSSYASSAYKSSYASSAYKSGYASSAAYTSSTPTRTYESESSAAILLGLGFLVLLFSGLGFLVFMLAGFGIFCVVSVAILAGFLIFCVLSAALTFYILRFCCRRAWWAVRLLWK